MQSCAILLPAAFAARLIMSHTTGMGHSPATPQSHRNARFTATRWSIVAAAGGDREGTDAQAALAELARIYWYPLYAFLRRQGCDAHEAEDFTQAFFTRLIDKHDLADVDQSKGKFRSFLLASAKHFLLNQRARAKALKRGGGRQVVSLDSSTAEARYTVEPTDPLTPERLFERQWALALLEQVLGRLQADYEKRGKVRLFQALKPLVAAGAQSPAHAEIAKQLDMNENTVRTAAHRLRRRYRQVLREEIAQTLTDVHTEDQVEEELRYLLDCL